MFSGNTVVFDLSDSSLSSSNASTLYSAFDMNLYRDSNFTDRFDGTLSNNTFEITKSGKVGIDADAKLTLVVNNNVPENLFYKFSVINSDFVDSSKIEIVVDKEVRGFNKIDVVDRRIKVNLYSQELDPLSSSMTYKKFPRDLHIHLLMVVYLIRQILQMLMVAFQVLILPIRVQIIMK